MSDRLRITAGAAILYPALYYFDSAGWFSALLPAVMIHEAGHLLALRACCVPVYGITVDIAGICIDSSEMLSPRQEALCAAAGPAAGLLWWGLMSRIPGKWAEMGSWISLVLTAFNLLPVMPLDGGRIFLSLTGQKTVVRILGIVIPILLLIGAALTGAYRMALPAVMILHHTIRS